MKKIFKQYRAIPLTDAEIDKQIAKTVTLNKECIRNNKQIHDGVHFVISGCPGDTFEERKKYAATKYKEHGVKLHSTLYRVFQWCALEIELNAPPGTLKTSHARLLVALEKSSERRQAFDRAIEIAGSESLAANHIRRAIEEITAPPTVSVKRPKIQTESLKNMMSKRRNKAVANDQEDENESDAESDDDDILEEVNAEEIFKLIAPFLDSLTTKILLIRMLKAPKSFWNICKTIVDFEFTDDKTNELIQLVDPDGKCQKIIAQNSNQKAKTKLAKSKG